MIRREEDPMGMGGYCLHVEDPGDLRSLDRRAARRAKPLAGLFEAWRGSLEMYAKKAPLESMARWLRQLAAARTCTLELYETNFFGAEARLRFEVRKDVSPSFSVLSTPLRGGSPKLLAQVHALTDHIDLQYGCSGTLVRWKSIADVRRLVAQQAIMGSEELRPLLKTTPALAKYRGIYEANGDWLCLGPRGELVWLGGESTEGPFQRTRATLADALDLLFSQLEKGKLLEPDLFN